MLSRASINLFLLTLAGVLGLLLWSTKPSPLPPLTQLDYRQITHISIKGPEGREINIRRQQNQWMIGNRLANQSRIGELLKICQTPSLRRFPAPEELSPFGLEPAEFLMGLNEATLRFGSIDPINGWRYVLYGDQVHLIGDGFRHHLLAPAQAWLAQP